MDELDLVRSFRSGYPAASAAARERARTELRGATGGPPHRRRARLLAPVAAVAAAAAAAVVLLPSGGGGLATPEALAAEKLRQAAAVAERRPDERATGPGQYWYQRSLEAYLSATGERDPYSVIQPLVREQWIGRDGGGRVRTRNRGELRFPGARDRRRWLAAGAPDPGMEMDTPLVNEDAPPGAAPFSAGQEGLSYAQLVALPTDGDALYDRLRAAVGRGGGSGVDDELFTIVGDLLRSAPVPSALRAALYRVAARVPGIRFAGEVTDAAGRRGVGISRDDQGVRSMLIFDPASAELLGERETLLRRMTYVAGEPGTVIGESAVLTAGVVDSTRERP